MTDRPRIDQAVIDLYHDYTHGAFDRRAFMSRLAQLVGGAAAAAALLPLLGNDYARAQTVAEDDARLTAETLSYDADGAPMAGYLVRATGGVKRPAVIVVHENRGLNPHIRDVARRYALAGYLTLAVDVLTPEGGTPADEDKAREMIGALDADAASARIAAAVSVLAAHPEATGAVGVVGFCWGGMQANLLAARAPEALKAAVAYYGRQAPLERVGAIRAALMLHYAENDERVNAGIEAYVAALTAVGVRHEMHMYAGAQHAFNNDTNAARFDATAAGLAHERTLAFLAAELGTPPAL